MRHPRRWLFISALALAVVASSALAQWQKDGARVCTAAGSQRLPHLLGVGPGGVILAWLDHRSGTRSDIYAQRLDANGVWQWSAGGLAVCTATGDKDLPSPTGEGAPAIAGDGAGGAIITWSDTRSGNSDIYAQRVLASGTVDPAWPVNGRALCIATGLQERATIVADGAGGAIVTWEDHRGVEKDIYAQHVLASGAVDPAWPVNGRALCTAANLQIEPTIASDGSHGAIVTWQDFRNSGSGYDIYAQHVLASGAVDPAWPADGRALCTAVNPQYSPRIVSDKTGGAIVAWYDYRGGVAYDIYAQHVLASGAVDPGWPGNGRALCTAVGDQDLPAMVADGSGGAIVTWEDHRTVDYYDIYAQHVLATGAVDSAWPVNGRAVCTAINPQSFPAISGDGAGGAYVTWLDQRDVQTDVYAHHLLASGALSPGWPVDGQALCTASNSEDHATIVGDGKGGAVVAWEDNRGGADTHLYVQRVTGSGGVASAPVPPPPVRAVLHAPYPNPSPAGLVRIPFDLASGSRVTAQIVDAAGHQVRALAIDRDFPSGRQILEWDGRNDQRMRMPAGVYFIQVRVGTYRDARRLVLLE